MCVSGLVSPGGKRVTDLYKVVAGTHVTGARGAEAGDSNESRVLVYHVRSCRPEPHAPVSLLKKKKRRKKK